MIQVTDPATATAYHELDVVAIRAAIWADGHMYPSGSQGTIVHVDKRGEAFEVEFDSPAPIVVTLEPGDLGDVQWRA